MIANTHYRHTDNGLGMQLSFYLSDDAMQNLNLCLFIRSSFVQFDYNLMFNIENTQGCYLLTDITCYFPLFLSVLGCSLMH